MLPSVCPMFRKSSLSVSPSIYNIYICTHTRRNIEFASWQVATVVVVVEDTSYLRHRHLLSSAIAALANVVA